ncbi:MAG TPA: Ig-like domain-containing protein, partial [Ramlibacter sp.]|nr:Ig-like domain-containing protein [Ramlibacter sp.]
SGNDTFSGPAVLTGVTQAAHGTVQIINALAGTVRYTPHADFHGTDSYTYTVLAGGSEETATVTVAVSPVNDAPVSTLHLQGLAEEGATLTVAGSLADADGIPAGGVAYKWFADGAPIGAATGTAYTLTQQEVGKRISVVVSYVDGDGTPESVVTPLSAPVANVNALPVGGVSIAGVAEQGRTLTASWSISDADGLVAPSLQWLADDEAIIGAVGSAYTLRQDDVGKAISVRVRYVDGGGTLESVTSMATLPVANANDTPEGGVFVVGPAEQGATLTAKHTLTDPDGMGTIQWQWLADGTPIDEATADTFTLTQEQVGRFVTVVARYTDGSGHPEQVASVALAPVANRNDDPVGTVSISGSFQQGQLLVADVNLSDADGLGVLEYQWFDGDAPLGSDTAESLLLTQAHVGRHITLRVAYTDGAGTREAVFGGGGIVQNVNDAPTGHVVVTGTPEQGQMLTASSTLLDADGLGTVSWQWFRDHELLEGETAPTLLLTQAHVGRSISVRASYVDGWGTPEVRASAGTAPVVNRNDEPVGSLLVHGTPQQGQVLTLASTLDDPDGMGTPSYQWLADEVPIAGEVGETLTLTQAQVGVPISVRVTWTDSHGRVETFTSAATAPVQDVDDAPTGAVTLVGTARLGQVLSAVHSLQDADGMGPIEWRWYADDRPISWAGGATLELSADLVGKAITVEARYTDRGGAFNQVASEPSTAVEPGPTAVLQGMAYHWRSHVLLEGVSVQAVQTAPGSTGDLFHLRGVALDTATNTLTAQVWIDPATPSGTVEFSLRGPGPVAFTSTLGSSWLVDVHHGGPDALRVGAITLTEVTGPLQVGTVTIQLPSAAAARDVQWSEVMVGERPVLPFGLGWRQGVTEADGRFAFDTVPLGSYDLAASRGAADTGSAVNTADALAALRISLGLNANRDPDGSGPLQAALLSPYQVIAADINADGAVTTGDALAILRLAVKAPTTVKPAWEFLPETLDLWNELTQASALTRTHAGWDRAMAAELMQDTTVNLVGVLRGDVNGSWQPPGGGLDLDVTDPGYFQLLAAQLGVPAGIWGA